MPDTPQPNPPYPNDDSLPASESGDPQDATILSRSATLRRMVQRFQQETLSAALDIDRSQSSEILTSSESPLSVTPPAQDTPTDNLRQVVIMPSSRPEPKVLDSQVIAPRAETGMTGPNNDDAPWTLQQFFNGEIDLDAELAKRFPTMPMMSMVKFRTLGSHSGRRVATLSSQDGSASLTFDGDTSTKMIHMSFTLGSMLTLRFTLNELSDLDRSRWLELMKRDEGGLAFLWGQTRWSNDYVICIARKYFTNFYAFSPHNFEAAVRLTPGVIRQLLDWIEDIWSAGPPADETPPTLLTW
jgi:hypothetical protein